jgi:hypothetical protein
VSFAAQPFGERGLEFPGGVIRSDGDSHWKSGSFLELNGCPAL